MYAGPWYDQAGPQPTTTAFFPVDLGLHTQQTSSKCYQPFGIYLSRKKEIGATHVDCLTSCPGSTVALVRIRVRRAKHPPGPRGNLAGHDIRFTGLIDEETRVYRHSPAHLLNRITGPLYDR